MFSFSGTTEAGVFFMINSSHQNIYQPPQEILEKYARVLINFALNSGRGVQPGEVVFCNVPDVAKALGRELQIAILKAGAQPMIHLMPTGFSKDFFAYASEEQQTFFPEKYMRERVNLINHSVYVIANPDPEELKNIETSKIMRARNVKKKFNDWLTEKEIEGHFTWTLCLWGEQAKADIVGLSLEEYWQQIIASCFLDKDDPIAEWKRVFEHQERTKAALNSLSIEWLKIKGPDINMKIQLGADRNWEGGSGRNLPSFEIFTSPNWRGTEGWVEFNQPVYRYGKKMDGVRLEFAQGVVTKAFAKEGNEFLQEMLKTKNANKLGEYSLTDKRMSPITHVMAETLFDENISGPFGNTHMAIGNAYKECYKGDMKEVSDQEWIDKGFNDSAEHTDIISTTDRTVTAILTDGTEKVIYADGIFTLE
jgi:aminopeptidase